MRVLSYLEYAGCAVCFGSEYLASRRVLSYVGAITGVSIDPLAYKLAGERTLFLID